MIRKRSQKFQKATHHGFEIYIKRTEEGALWNEKSNLEPSLLLKVQDNSFHNKGAIEKHWDQIPQLTKERLEKG